MEWSHDISICNSEEDGRSPYEPNPIPVADSGSSDVAMVDIAEDTWVTSLASEASHGRCGSLEGIAVEGREELEDTPTSVSLFTTVIVGIDDSANGITGIAEPGSGVTDLEDLCSLDEAAPRNAAAVDVDVNAALRVLNAGGPVVLLRQAA